MYAAAIRIDHSFQEWHTSRIFLHIYTSSRLTDKVFSEGDYIVEPVRQPQCWFLFSTTGLGRTRRTYGTTGRTCEWHDPTRRQTHTHTSSNTQVFDVPRAAPCPRSRTGWLTVAQAPFKSRQVSCDPWGPRLFKWITRSCKGLSVDRALLQSRSRRAESEEREINVRMEIDELGDWWREKMKFWPAWLYFHINHLPGDHRCACETGGLAGVQRPRLTKTKHTHTYTNHLIYITNKSPEFS